MIKSSFGSHAVGRILCFVGLGAVILLPNLAVASLTKLEPQAAAESAEVGFDTTEREYRSAEDEFARRDLLRGMFRMNPERAFDHVHLALMSDTGCVQTEAAGLVARYYVRFAVYPDDSDHFDEEYSDKVVSARQMIVGRLRELSTWEKIKLSVASMRSLVRMGEIDSVLVESLYRVALGEGKERWCYDCLECGIVSDKGDYDAHQQKDASGVLLRLKRSGYFEKTIEAHLRDVLERVQMQSRETPSPAYDIMKNAIREELGEKEDGGDCRSSETYEESWTPYYAVNYASYWCDKRKSVDPMACDPYQDYDYGNRGGDCANFASQCLWAGGLDACGFSGCDGCVGDYCCTPLTLNLASYLEGRNGDFVVSYPEVVWENPDEQNPGDRAPAAFGPGDIVILYQEGRNGWRHTLVNVDGYCDYAHYACHTSDRCWATLDEFIGSGSTQFQKAKFFHIVPHSYCDTWGCIKNFYGGSESYEGSGPSALSSHDNTLVWNVPPHDPADYLIFKATDSDGDDDFVQIGNRLRQDTVFVDYATSAGHTYHYKVVSLKGDTLMECSLGSAGLKTMGEILPLPGLQNYPDAMVSRGNAMYVGLGSEVLKVDISSPLAPVVVGSRTLPCSYNTIWQLAILSFSGHDFVMCLTGCTAHTGHLFALDAELGELPVIGELYNFAPQNWTYDVTADDKGYAYVACGLDGIVAIDCRDPGQLSIADRYYGPTGSSFKAVEWVNGEPYSMDYLYAGGGTAAGGGDYYSEILELVFSPGGQFAFDSVCSSEQPECWPQSVHLETLKNGNPRGYYALGVVDDIHLCVLDISNPTHPSVLKRVAAPHLSGPFIDSYFSYEFDNRYLYLTTNMLNDWFGRSLYIVDILAPDSIPQFAVGDTLGQSSAGRVASRGRYLYFCDQLTTPTEPEHSFYPRLRVLEKAWGCDPTIGVSAALSPPPDAYMAGEPVTISWECTGCPIEVEVTLIEIGMPDERRNLTFMRNCDYPDLASSHFDWMAEGISADFENRWYQIEVTTRNIEGDTDSRRSSLFRIVEGKSGNVAVNTTWSDIVYLRGDIMVEPGVVLAVDPGTEIRVWPEDLGHTLPDLSKIAIQVRGFLDVNGTAVSPVLFHSRTGDTKWDWDGFYLDSQCTGAILEYCLIENAEEAIETEVTLLLTNSVVDSCVFGLVSYAGNLVVANSVVSNCCNGVFVTAGAPYTASVIGTTIENCQFGIRAFLDGVVDVRNTACRGNDYGLYTSSYGTVTVRENSSFKRNDIGIYCYGASPTVTDCVVDSNMTHGIACHYFSGPTIESSDIRYNSAGIFCYDSSEPVVRSNEITYNGDGVAAVSNSDPDVGTDVSYGRNNIRYNSGYHISNLTPGLTIMAEYNYWGVSTPPCLPKASKFSGAVDYNPALCGGSLLASAGPGEEHPKNEKTVPACFALGPAVPNPFNPTTTIHYEVPELGAPVDIRIYNVSGQLVRVIVAEYKTPGAYDIVWDGRDTGGQAVASSVYFIQMKSIDFEKTRKIMLIK